MKSGGWIMSSTTGTKRDKKSVETQIEEFTQFATDAIDVARSKMTTKQVREADRKTSEMISSATRTKQ
jgi:hypothetical protein